MGPVDRCVHPRLIQASGLPQFQVYTLRLSGGVTRHAALAKGLRASRLDRMLPQGATQSGLESRVLAKQACHVSVQLPDDWHPFGGVGGTAGGPSPTHVLARPDELAGIEQHSEMCKISGCVVATGGALSYKDGDVCGNSPLGAMLRISSSMARY